MAKRIKTTQTYQKVLYVTDADGKAMDVLVIHQRDDGSVSLHMDDYDAYNGIRITPDGLETIRKTLKVTRAVDDENVAHGFYAIAGDTGAYGALLDWMLPRNKGDNNV